MSKRFVYSIHLLLDLATGPKHRVTVVEEVARRHGLSAKYLGVVASLLRKSGILEGKRGMGGGFRLARDPSMITLADVLVATEGNLKPAVSGRGDSLADRIVARALHELVERWLQTASQIPFQQLIEEYHAEVTASAHDFVI